MEPMVIAIMVILVVLLIGVITVWSIYQRRTQQPEIDVEGIISNLIPKPPTGLQ